MIDRIAVDHLRARPCRKAEVVDVAGLDLRFAGIEPEDLDPGLVVVGPQLVPEVAASLWIGGIVEGDRESHRSMSVRPVRVNRSPPLACDQVPGLKHRLVVGRHQTHRGPHRHHEANPHGFELRDHRPRVGPLARLKAPISELGPVEEVNDYDREGEPTSVVLPRHLQQLLLGAIAELGLPEPRRPLGEHRGVPCHPCVVRCDLCRRAGGDPVVDLLGAVRDPAGGRGSELDPADRRVVP